jgi:hypothetical protein
MARAHSLRIAKQKRPRRRKVKAAIKRQLDYLQQNLRAVDSLIACGAMLSELKRHWWHKLLACSELERQQSWMLMNKTNSIPDRLVHLVQTHVRPIVRGKARTPVEFGAKISVSVQNGFPFLHRINWNPYNEGADLIEQAEKYKRDTGSYPGRICADQIYITAKNRHYCMRAFASQASAWAGHLRILMSPQPRNGSSGQIKDDAMRWRMCLAQENANTASIGSWQGSRLALKLRFPWRSL